MLNERDIQRQKKMIEDLRKLVKKATADDDKKALALQYCDGCIAACEIALGEGKKNAEPVDAPSPMEQLAQSMIEATTGEKVEAVGTATAEEPAKEEEPKPKKTRSRSKKKEEPAPVPVEESTPAPVQETLEPTGDDDLDDLI